MRTMLLGMLAETFVHPGTGQTDGAIDLRVAREAASDYPFIPGSGMKGAMRDYARTFGQWTERPSEETGDADPSDDRDGKAARVFGRADQAGKLLFGDARLLLLPVRSLSGAYKWVTCPHLIERLLRDLSRAEQSVPVLAELPVGLANGDLEETPWILAAETAKTLFLEERLFALQGQVPDDIHRLVETMIADDRAAARLKGHLAMVSNNQFAGLAQSCLAITARNKLDENTKRSDALWYEEALPPDAVMYTLICERDARQASLKALGDLLETRPYLQLGGNETTGQGWFKLKPVEVSA